MIPEAAAQSCSVKNVFLEISQHSQENTCAKDSYSQNNVNSNEGED